MKTRFFDFDMEGLGNWKKILFDFKQMCCFLTKKTKIKKTKKTISHSRIYSLGDKTQQQQKNKKNTLESNLNGV